MSETEQVQPTSGATSKKKNHGGFFAISKDTWHKACDLGLNAAVALLVLARFSQGDNKTTGASATAISTHTHIRWPRAKAAIEQLIKARLLRRKKGGTKPRYAIAATRKRRRLDAVIWLPNELVTGAGSEVPPVEKLRQHQDVMCLRLFIDLYSVQERTGIDREYVHWKYEREHIGQQGEYDVIGFRSAGGIIANSSDILTPHLRQPSKEEKAAGRDHGVDFWPRIDELRRLRLVTVEPVLYESEKDEASPIYSLDGLWHRATAAARTLLTEGQYEYALGAGYWLVPVHHHTQKAQVYGILQLRYQARTALGRMWWLQRRTAGDEWGRRFDRMSGLSEEPSNENDERKAG